MTAALLAILLAALCAGLMGFAIQRGATCAVAAVEEVIAARSCRRLLAMMEAAAWVAAGLLVANALGVPMAMPAGHALHGGTVAGAVLLGLGAWLNRACAFGSVARLGSGDWAYLATPLGFFAGCLVFARLVPAGAGPLPSVASPVLQAPGWVAAPVALVMAWRLARHARGRWTPHAATTVIGITFLAMLLLVGAWSYTDALAELAHGMAGSTAVRMMLFVALLAGAVLGGWLAGASMRARVTPAALLRCFAGGAIMAWGGLLVPGANDGLILLGMPLFWPYAWVAFVVMCLAIAGARLGQGVFLRPAAQPRG